MRKTFFPAAVACVVAAAVLAACKAQDNAPGLASSPPQSNAEAARAQVPSQSDGVRRMTIEELQDSLAKSDAVVVDVRPKDQYAQGHIKGALSMPFSEIGARSDELPKDKTIVLYCA